MLGLRWYRDNEQELSEMMSFFDPRNCNKQKGMSSSAYADRFQEVFGIALAG